MRPSVKPTVEPSPRSTHSFAGERVSGVRRLAAEARVFSSVVTVVTSLIDVVNSLFDPRNRPPRGRAMQRLGDGMVHVEYPEDDYVYLVTSGRFPVPCCHLNDRSQSMSQRGCRSS
jgi:hypothetical protein